MIIYDTSVFVDHLRLGRHEQLLAEANDIVRNSSVVLAELWRSANKRDEQIFLEDLADNFPILIPTQKDWLESGRLVGRIRVDLGFTAEKLRDLHFDVLIALTARSNGARVITSNRKDYELIKSYRAFKLEIW